nr:MAG TPA: hypothetical protein [Siphoviridae sp. ctngg6]
MSFQYFLLFSFHSKRLSLNKAVIFSKPLSHKDKLERANIL